MNILNYDEQEFEFLYFIYYKVYHGLILTKPITCKYCGHVFQLSYDAKKEWLQNKLVCPSCQEVYCCLPQTERELRILQDTYYENGQKERDLTELVKLLSLYCRSLILKSFSNKIYYEGQLEYYTHLAVSYFIEEYCVKENFQVTTSFAGLLNFKIRQAIFGKAEYIIGDETLDFVFEDGHNVAYEDPKFNYVQIEEEKQELLHLYQHILQLIFGVEKYCSSKKENYIRLFNIWQFLIGGEKHLDTFYSVYDKKSKNITLKTLDILKEELKKNCVF